MARAWPASVDRAQPSSRLVGEFLLAALLLVTLAFSQRDTVPDEPFVYDLPTQSEIADVLVPGNKLSGPHITPNVDPPLPPQPRVPTAAPVQLLIPTLDVHRAIEKVGTDRFGVMSLPLNAWNAAWFKGSPVPGAPGDAVIAGHAGAPAKPMIFGKLMTMKPGDRIIVVLADGSRQLFLVVSMTTVAAGTAPRGLAEPYGIPRLTLITCTGHFDKKSFWYSDRLVLQAKYAGML
jgi:LPXTG-site transpeptidase (sortase) family protein